MRSKLLYEKAKTLIPGGTQLLSKRPERFLPTLWPTYYTRAKGAYIWDLENRCYLDMTTSGIGTCVLGYADPDVEEAVIKAIMKGSMSTLNCTEEIELASLLIELHSWADMVRFARCGGEGMAIAVRIARACTGKDKIAFCGYHGWHDWYIAANLSGNDALNGHLLPGLSPSGVPSVLENTMHPFKYNEIDDLEKIISEQKGELAAIVMEPARSQGPAEKYLLKVKECARRAGAVLIFDEVTSGWRMNTGGIHLHYDVAPDIAVFAKAMSNGYPMAAIIGVDDVMRVAQDLFISSTYWTERIGPTAALATIRKHKSNDVGSHLVQVGKIIQEKWKDLSLRYNIKLKVMGVPPLSHISFDYENSDAVMTLYSQLMLDRGILASASFYPSYSHTSQIIDVYINAAEEVFYILNKAVEEKNVESLLRGEIRKPGFSRMI